MTEIRCLQAVSGANYSNRKAYNPDTVLHITPQTDGQTEVVNRCLENYLHCFVGNRPKDWMKSLSLVDWWYNSSQHSATGISPYEVVYGYPPHRLISYVKGTTRVAAVEEHLKDREQITKLLKENLQAAQQRMKNQADLHRPG